MGTPRLASVSKQCWPSWPTLVLALGAGCSWALDNRQRSVPDAAPEPEAKPANTELKFPNENLAAKHEAAKASPQSIEPVLAYAQGVADFCLTTLVDESCGANCPKEVVKYKPASELDVKNWVLTQDALKMLDAFKDGQGLPPAQFELFVGVKGRLLGLAGHAAEEQALIENYAQAHPDAVTVVRRRLELLRQGGDVKVAEAQCARSRARMKSAPDSARLELLTSCVALHPYNADGKTDPPDYTRYLPNPTKAEQRLYRRHLVQRCVENVGSKETRCKEACACADPSADKQQKAKCKASCRDCRMEMAQRIRDCRKFGGVLPAPGARPKTGAAVPRAKAGDSEPKPMEL